MQRAGTAAAAEIARRYADRLRGGAFVFTGPGNNGGDGWVVAGLLARSGIEVTVVEVVEANTPDAIAEKRAAADAVKTVSGSAAAELDGAQIVIDALLGTGAQGEPRGQITSAISKINQMHSDGAKVAALDLPSGLDATTGYHSMCVIADVTFSFGAAKRGSLLARDCCGDIVVLDIGLDETSLAAGEETLPWLVDGPWVHAHVPDIRYDAHKGTRKHLAIIGGGQGMGGAVVLATRAALRSGIGLVRALVAPENVGEILAAAPSALIAPWPATPAETSSQISNWADAIVIGPGLGKSDDSRRLVESILADSTLPVLLDADALNVFDGDVDALGRLLEGKLALITPHVAEFARLAKIDVKQVVETRFDVGGEMARRIGATVLLKGSPTVIFAPDGERYVVARGTAALGTGGSGDLLAGIAGTMLAQTLDASTSASSAAWIHGRAAELCEYVRGTTLDDVLYALPRAWNESEPSVNPPVLAELPGVSR
ncbi:MAG: ADP-dependent NAD(P)H-hydrate dehydratase / NAD(P)H-hydrate epimerase [Gemmatimonadaceae bacterium]|nr:ADP-dependent NAD(P)H-hydrate dehydratase / NAD(P)H-hydrate epimerase [Gemmatimonadaceae bacterium]